MNPVIVFSVAAIPDVAALRELHRLPSLLSDFEVGEYALQRQRANGSLVLPPHLQRIVAVSCAVRGAEGFRVQTFSAGEAGMDEAAILRGFTSLLQAHAPSPCVSWHGEAVALPLLRLRALIHGVVMPATSFMQHRDLAVGLYGQSASAGPSLGELARLSGLPAIEEHDSDDLWALSQNGSDPAIPAYSAARAITTYLLHLRWLLVLDELDQAGLNAECRMAREALENDPCGRWAAFLAKWPSM